MPDRREDLEPLVLALMRVREGSAFLLDVAMAALERDGVAGELRIHIPRKAGERPEVEFFGTNPPPKH